jgi:hypothetical protein
MPLVLSLFLYYLVPEPTRRSAMTDHALDRQEALLLAIGWAAALWLALT